MATQNERFFVTELIRETILEQYSEEVPYSCEVLIEEFKERENSKDYISAEFSFESLQEGNKLLEGEIIQLKTFGTTAREIYKNF